MTLRGPHFYATDYTRYTAYGHWQKRYPHHIAKALIMKLGGEANKVGSFGGNHYENVDNLRACEVGNLEEEAAYEKLYNNGCCGYKDWEVTIEGKTYKIGFNFGH